MRTKTVRLRLIKLAVALAVAILLAYFQKPINKVVTSAPQVAASDYTVTKTIDGDTIQIKMGDKTETVRFIGVDTPETHDPRKAVQCYGQQAAAKTHEWLYQKQVRLETDPNDSDRDKYGRLLRYVYVGDILVNQELIKEGYAFTYVVFPFAKMDAFRTSEQEARLANRGLWGICQVNESTKIKQTNSL